MPQKTSCLLALALAVGSALVTFPSQAQTEANAKGDITTLSSQSSVSNDSIISKLKKSKAVNQNKATNIAQSQPSDSSTTANTQKPQRVRIPVYSRIGFGLSQ
ncbi:MAG: hypothetical protein KI793_01800 [Rivularia sp. (in: Bacteria)]|nr:hypothetical protein [Rivularia sp. MS3]